MENPLAASAADVDAESLAAKRATQYLRSGGSYRVGIQALRFAIEIWMREISGLHGVYERRTS